MAPPFQREAYHEDDQPVKISLVGYYLADAAMPQAAPCRRIEQHLTELFVVVADRAAPADTNGAERRPRHPATAREISGGARSPEGSATELALATLSGAWRARGLNPFRECCPLVAEPQV